MYKTWVIFVSWVLFFYHFIWFTFFYLKYYLVWNLETDLCFVELKCPHVTIALKAKNSQNLFLLSSKESINVKHYMSE